MGRHVPRLVVGFACLLIVVMYACNHDMAGKPDVPRGTGQYLPILDRGDGHMMYLMARSTAIDLDWVFDNDLARFGDPWHEPRTQTGRKSIVMPIGPALVWTPLIWISDAGAAIVNLFGADIPLNGYTLWTQRFVFLSSALFGCGAVLLGAWLTRRLALGRWATMYAAIAVLLGTSLTYYATYMPSYGHAMDAMICAALLAWWAKTLGRSDPKRWIVLGALLGVAALVRVQDFAFGVVVLVELAFAARDRKAALRIIAGGAITLAVAVIVFTPQLLEWHLVFGKAFAVPQGPQYTRFSSPMILELLFAPRNGWLVTTPIAYAGLIGLALIPREHRVIAVGLAAATIVQIYLNSTIADWWAAASFGQRRLCSVTLPLVIGNAALLTRLARTRLRWLQHAAVVLVFGALVVTNLVRVWHLRGGKPAPQMMSPTCCAGMPRFVVSAYDHVGNPFELPASAIFAIRHRVPLAVWDRIVGEYPLEPPFGAFRDSTLHHIKTTWHPRADFVTSDGRVLVPILVPAPTHIKVTLKSGTARVRWDGDDVGSDFTVDPSVGTHELSFDGPAEVAAIELELL